MTATISVAINDSTGRLALDKVIDGLTTSKVLDQVDAMLFNRTRTRYLAQQTPDGETWEPSHAATAENRQTLFDTGNLFRSIQLYRVSESKSMQGTDVEYAKDHNEGENGQLKREFLGFGVEDEELARAYVLSYLNDLTGNGELE